MNNQIIPANQDVVNLRNLLTVYDSYSDSVSGYGIYFAMQRLDISEKVADKVMEYLDLFAFSNLVNSQILSNGLFDSQTELGRRQINAVLEVINELQPENVFDNSFGFD